MHLNASVRLKQLGMTSSSSLHLSTASYRSPSTHLVGAVETENPIVSSIRADEGPPALSEILTNKQATGTHESNISRHLCQLQHSSRSRVQYFPALTHSVKGYLVTLLVLLFLSLGFVTNHDASAPSPRSWMGGPTGPQAPRCFSGEETQNSPHGACCDDQWCQMPATALLPLVSCIRVLAPSVPRRLWTTMDVP